MFSLGQLIGMGIMGLLAGLVTQNFAKKRHQERLGNIGLISCIVAAFVGGLMGMYWGLAAVTALGFIAYIQVKT
jgi:uncharacterized membrane-anchored protein